MLIFAQICGCVLMLALAAFLFFLAWSLAWDRIQANRDRAYARHVHAARLIAANDIKSGGWWFSENKQLLEGFLLAGEFLESGLRIDSFRDRWLMKRQSPAPEKEQA